MEPTLKLPRNWHIYYSTVVDRVQKYIDYGIWDGFSKQNLLGWVKNFKTDPEKYFAARILDSLLYRSERHFISLAKEFAYVLLPQSIDVSEDYVNRLARRPSLPFRFVLSVEAEEHYGKSPNIIQRLLIRFCGIHEDYFMTPGRMHIEFSEDFKYFFIDDFAGTGEQFISNIISWGNEINDRVSNSGNFVFAPLIMHILARQNISVDFPQIRFLSAEMLDYTHSIFNQDSYFANDGENSSRDYKLFYLSLLEKFEINDDQERGYGELDLLLAFQHATPDNSIPLIRAENDRFHRLFQR